MKEERKRLIRRLSFLEDMHSRECALHNCSCVYAKEIKAIGVKLFGEEKGVKNDGRLNINLVEYQNLKHQGIKDENIAKGQGISVVTLYRWKKRNGISTDLKTVYTEISLDVYQKLKASGLNDKQIWQHLGLTAGAMRTFKLKNGLVNRHS